MNYRSPAIAALCAACVFCVSLGGATAQERRVPPSETQQTIMDKILLSQLDGIDHRLQQIDQDLKNLIALQHAAATH